MASVYKRKYRKPDGRLVECDTHTVECKIGDAFRRLPGYRDKRASEELGRKVERLANLRESGEQPDAGLIRWLEGLSAKLRNKLVRFGLLDRASVASAKPLRDHLDDYKQALFDKGNTPKHAELVARRVETILDGAKATHLSDLTAVAVSRYLAERRKLDRADGGLSAQSSNHYLRAAKSFCGWLVKEQRAADNPLAHLSAVNVSEDRRHVRRALEAD